MSEVPLSYTGLGAVPGAETNVFIIYIVQGYLAHNKTLTPL
jgi:hypothetical protein